MVHQGPLLLHDKDYNGSRFNVLVEWENGEITTEPLLVIAADDPVTCAVYAREHDLLDVEGWKHFWNLPKCEKHFLCLVKQAKMKSYHQSPKYKFGYRIPRLDICVQWVVKIRLATQTHPGYPGYAVLATKARDECVSTLGMHRPL
jgi:hypothetical protein